MDAAVPYQIAWRWRKAVDPLGIVKHDDVEATNVRSALSKLRERLGKEYALARGDIEALEVYRI